MNINNALFALEQLDGFTSEGKSTEEDIKSLEAVLGIHLPDEYRMYLRQYRSAHWDEGEIYGLSHDEYYDVISRTLESRNYTFPDEFEPFPENCIVLEEYAGGGYYLIFCKGSERAGEVSLILSELANNEEEFWNSFSDFIDDMYLSELPQE